MCVCVLVYGGSFKVLMFWSVVMKRWGGGRRLDPCHCRLHFTAFTVGFVMMME